MIFSGSPKSHDLSRAPRDTKFISDQIFPSKPSTPPLYHKTTTPIAFHPGKIPPDLTPKARAFYAKYDHHEGITTAVVLGGFFVFVCLLVMYKTKLKPMWKERHEKNIDAPQANPSEVTGSLNHFHRDFECIPLQTIQQETCEIEDDEELYFMDELGNYVFPLVHPQMTTCSCPQR